MRLHISLEDGLVEELDRRVGPRRRSAFIEDALRRALENEQRWDAIERGIGAISDGGHEWDDDPAEWVRQQRFADPERIG